MARSRTVQLVRAWDLLVIYFNFEPSNEFNIKSLDVSWIRVLGWWSKAPTPNCHKKEKKRKKNRSHDFLKHIFHVADGKIDVHPLEDMENPVLEKEALVSALVGAWISPKWNFESCFDKLVSFTLGILVRLCKVWILEKQRQK